MERIVEKAIPWGANVHLPEMEKFRPGKYAFNNCVMVRSGTEAGIHVTYMDSGCNMLERFFPWEPKPNPEPEPVAEPKPEAKPKREKATPKKSAKKKGGLKKLFRKKGPK